ALGDSETYAAVCFDVNGSVRRVAAQNDFISIKPTYGTVSRYGTIPVACSGETVSVVAEDAENYKIELVGGKFELRCTNPLTKLEKVKINVFYDPNAMGGFVGYNVGSIELTVSPNIKINLESTRWVKYGENDEYYFKMVKGESSLFSELLIDNFILDGTVIDAAGLTEPGRKFDFIPNENGFVNGLYILDREELPLGTTLTVGDIYNLYTNNDVKATEENKLQIIVELSNGSKMSFNVILLPVDIPFVTYPNLEADDYRDVNISDLLLITENVDWLIENSYYYTITETKPLVNDGGVYSGGTQIGYSLEDLATNSGIQLIDGATYTVDKGQYANYQDGLLGTSPTGADTFVVLTANLGSEGIVDVAGLKIPYLIKIQKELSMGIYYPYDSTAVDSTQTVSDADLKDYESTYVREYISFGANGQVTIDLLETQKNTVPNKSNITSKRITILKGTEEYLDDKAREKIRFEVTKVYCDAITGFMKINDVSRYAKFSSAQNSGQLTIYSNGSQKIRLEIKITAGEGLYAYYYISVGEVPTNMQLRYGAGDPCSINIVANREYDNILNEYTLLQIIP
ncbi:MAG: hypothetical protein J6Q51_02290, partial [Clostridia bacterium]|nr:hypothetical protein [Clostridia bacterium]